MHIIGIAGQAESGKTTSANYLLAKLGYPWTTDAFADPIKRMLEQIGVDCSDEMKNVTHPILGKTPRELMQSLGTGWGRDMVGIDTWVKLLAERNPKGCLIISDVRMENEADFIRANGGIIIHLKGKGGINSDHSSEHPILIQASDSMIQNTGTPIDLKIHLDIVVDKYLNSLA